MLFRLIVRTLKSTAFHSLWFPGLSNVTGPNVFVTIAKKMSVRYKSRDLMMNSKSDA